MNIIDTKINLSSERPQLKIGDKLYKVDNRKKTYDKFMKIQADNTISEDEKEEKIMEIFLGEKQAKEILNIEMTVAEYKYLTFCVLGAVTNESPEKLMENAEKNM